MRERRRKTDIIEESEEGREGGRKGGELGKEMKGRK